MTETSKKIDAFMEKEDDFFARSFAKAIEAVNEKPTAQNIRSYESAKAAYESYKKNQNKNILQNILEAVEYLKTEGWKIEKSKAYEDRHLMNPQKDGSFLKSEIDKYAQRFLRKNDGSDIGASAEDKLKWDAKIAEQKFKDMEFEAKIKQGVYVIKSEVEQMLAARASFLKDNLGQGFIHARASRIVKLVKGNSDRIPELIDFWLKQIDEVFDYYSKPLRFEAPAMITNEEELKEDE